MPIYEFECEECSLKFDLLRKVGEGREAPCPQCQGRSRRVFSSVPFIFKGSRRVGESNTPKKLSADKTKNDKKPEKGEQGINNK